MVPKKVLSALPCGPTTRVVAQQLVLQLKVAQQLDFCLTLIITFTITITPKKD
jgi:hypothetical protein